MIIKKEQKKRREGNRKKGREKTAQESLSFRTALSVLAALLWLSLFLFCGAEEDDEPMANPQHLEWAQEALDAWGIGLRNDLIHRGRGNIRNWITVANSGCRVEGTELIQDPNCLTEDAIGVCYLYVYPPSGHIVHTTAIMRKDFLEDSRGSENEKLAVFIHEIGHCLGLQHSDKTKIVFDLPVEQVNDGVALHSYTLVKAKTEGTSVTAIDRGSFAQYPGGAFITTCGDNSPTIEAIKGYGNEVTNEILYTFGSNPADSRKCLMYSYNTSSTSLPHPMELAAIQNTYRQGQLSSPPGPWPDQFYEFMQYNIKYSPSESEDSEDSEDLIVLPEEGAFIRIDNIMHYDPPPDCQHFCNPLVEHHENFPEFYISATIGNAMRIEEEVDNYILDAQTSTEVSPDNWATVLPETEKSSLIHKSYVMYADGSEDIITLYPDGTKTIESHSAQDMKKLLYKAAH